MGYFIKFIDNKSRIYFFSKIKENSNLTWVQIIKKENISGSSLDYYKSGSSSIPEKLFNKFLTYLSEEDKKKFKDKVLFLDSQSWLKKGGRNAYKINVKKFDEGRLKGIDSIRMLAKISKTFSFPNFKLSPNICEFIGAFIGDGFFNCYNNKLYQIEFAGDNRYDLDYYKNTIIPYIKEVILEVKPHIYFVKNKNSLRVVFYSKQLFQFLKNELGFTPGVKTYTVTIPKMIMNAEERYINKTIRGIFDTDGSLFFDKRKKYTKPYPRICLQIASKPLYNQLVNYLSNKFSIHHGKLVHRNLYYIELYGFDSLEKWMSIIGFSNPRHLNKLPW